MMVLDSDSEKAPAHDHPARPAGSRFNPWLFFGFLIAPGIFSILSLLSDSSSYGEKSFVVLSVGSVISGLVCGIHFALCQARLSGGARFAVGVISVIGCAGVAFALGFGGCYVLGMAGI